MRSTNKFDEFLSYVLKLYLFLMEQVVHENSNPSEIVFTVQSPPNVGFLLKNTTEHQKNNGEQPHVYQETVQTETKRWISGSDQTTPIQSRFSF